MGSGLFLDLPKGKQNELLLYFKNMLGVTWIKIAELLKINKSMVYFYRNDVCRMPVSHIEKLCSLVNIEIAKLQINTISMPHCVRKKVLFPRQSESFAEFMGVLSGDGCLSRASYLVCVTCDGVLDYLYVTRVVIPLFKDLFGIVPKLRSQNGAVHCWVYSKNLFEFLSNKFPVGKKKNKLCVPSWIIKNRKYSIAFIRGLFDTDGGVHRHHKNSIQLGFTSSSQSFLLQVFNLMEKIGLNPKLGKYDIWFFGDSAVEFFEIIHPNNPKHIFKFKQFKERGAVPLSKELYAGAGIRTRVTTLARSSNTTIPPSHLSYL